MPWRTFAGIDLDSSSPPCAPASWWRGASAAHKSWLGTRAAAVREKRELCEPSLGIPEAGRNPGRPCLDAEMQPGFVVVSVVLFCFVLFRKRVIPKEFGPRLSEQRMIADFRNETCYW